MSAAFIVVVGEAHYGPFPSRDAAHEWTAHPDRTVEVSHGYRVVPLFGGLFLDSLPGEPETQPIEDAYPGQFGLVGDGMAERCYHPGCDEFVTGASDFCSAYCEAVAS